MTRFILTGLAAGFGLLLACSVTGYSQQSKPACDCDTAKARQLVTSKKFNRIPAYDTATFTQADFYTLNAGINRMLWFRDIENADTTKFTRLWKAHQLYSYRAKHTDFVKHYNGRKDIELAFQLGPNSDLSAYDNFVIKKIGCCYLITRSYFRQGHFSCKYYSILSSTQVDLLYAILDKINVQPVSDIEEYVYCGYFADNRNKKTFFINFEKEIDDIRDGYDEVQPKVEVRILFDFIDRTIRWTKTM